MLQLSMYTERTAKLNNITARMNQGALLPIADSAIPPALYADDAISLRTMDAARQKEMKESITVLAITTRVAAERGILDNSCSPCVVGRALLTARCRACASQNRRYNSLSL